MFRGIQAFPLPASSPRQFRMAVQERADRPADVPGFEEEFRSHS